MVMTGIFLKNPLTYWIKVINCHAMEKFLLKGDRNMLSCKTLAEGQSDRNDCS